MGKTRKTTARATTAAPEAAVQSGVSAENNTQATIPVESHAQEELHSRASERVVVLAAHDPKTGAKLYTKLFSAEHAERLLNVPGTCWSVYTE